MVAKNVMAASAVVKMSSYLVCVRFSAFVKIA